MLVDENGDLVLVNVSSDRNGYYHCQTNESGTIINGSSYELTVQNSMGSLDGEPIQSHLVAMCYMACCLIHAYSCCFIVSCKSMPFKLVHWCLSCLVIVLILIVKTYVSAKLRSLFTCVNSPGSASIMTLAVICYSRIDITSQYRGTASIVIFTLLCK